ncbi:MAG: hypothetical protein JWO96_854 [Candidatus Saccharibacteria bacterium]|nr:hypothetical protein [Candidatus Saccharibacteria bacterium]
MSKPQAFIDRFLKDKNGQVAVWQTPNLPLIVWAAATLAAKIAVHGRAHQILDLIAFGALFAWAWLEVFQGASYFRRALGLIVLILSIYSRS